MKKLLLVFISTIVLLCTACNMLNNTSEITTGATTTTTATTTEVTTTTTNITQDMHPYNNYVNEYIEHLLQNRLRLDASILYYSYKKAEQTTTKTDLYEAYIIEIYISTSTNKIFLDEWLCGYDNTFKIYAAQLSSTLIND